jgi:polyhydroxybutyrate depolymerase
MRHPRPLAVALAAAALAACGDGDPVDPPCCTQPTVYGGARPVTLGLPASIQPGERYPLVLVLHGYGATGALQASYLGLGALGTDPGAFVLAPNGTQNGTGQRFWDASPACCNATGTPVDDVAYLGGLLDAVMADWPVDPARVVVIGHSNGGFMAFRLACERADVVTAIADLAGAAVSGGLACAPSRSVSVLHVHGDADGTIPYAGGSVGGATFPGAETSVATWAGLDGCGTTWTDGSALSFAADVPGAETATRSADGCPPGVDVELWRVQGGSHVPLLEAGAGRAMVDWMLARPRP